MAESKQAKRKIATDSAFLTIGGYLIKLKGLIFMPLIIRSVGIENYGVFIQLFVNLAMVAPFCTLALGEGFKRFASQYDESDTQSLRRDFWTVMTATFITASIGGLALFVFAPSISSFLFRNLDPQVVWAARFSGLMVFERVIWEQMNKFLLGRKRFKKNTLLLILFKFIPYTGMMIGFIFAKSLLIAIVLYLALESVFVVILFVQLIRELPIATPDVMIFRRYLRYSWPLTLTSFEGSLLAKMDRYFISYFIGPGALGAYNIVYNVAGLLDELSVPFRRYFSSYLPQLWDSGNGERALTQLRTGIKYYVTISSLALAFILMVLEPTIDLLVDVRLPAIDDIQMLILVLGLGIIGEGTIRLFNQVVNLHQKNVYLIWVELLGVILNAGLNFILIPKLGLLGAGVATLFSYSLVLVACAFFFPIRADLRLVSSLIFALGVLIPAFFLSEYGIRIGLLASGAIGLIICSLHLTIGQVSGALSINEAIGLIRPVGKSKGKNKKSKGYEESLDESEGTS